MKKGPWRDSTVTPERHRDTTEDTITDRLDLEKQV